MIRIDTASHHHQGADLLPAFTEIPVPFMIIISFVYSCGLRIVSLALRSALSDIEALRL